MARFDDQTELIRALFAGATDAPVAGSVPWSAFLDRLINVTQADHAALCIEGVDCWSVGEGATVSPDLRQRLRIDRVYDQDGLPLAYWRDGFLRVVKTRIGPSSHVTVWVQRRPHRKDFRSADGHSLLALTPFLGQAADIWVALDRERTEARRSEDLAARLGCGWVNFDRSGLIRSMSTFVRDWGDRQDLRLADRRRIESPDPEVAQSLRLAFSDLQGGAVRSCVSLSRKPLTELVLLRDEADQEGTVSGVLRSMPLVSDIAVGVLADHFRLNRSEARLVAQLCDGATLKSAAEALGWTEETTRTTSKSIFARLGLNGQPALIRRVAGSAVWF